MTTTYHLIRSHTAFLSIERTTAHSAPYSKRLHFSSVLRAVRSRAAHRLPSRVTATRLAANTLPVARLASRPGRERRIWEEQSRPSRAGLFGQLGRGLAATIAKHITASHVASRRQGRGASRDGASRGRRLT